MTLQSDQKVLAFLGAIAVLGAGVRVVRASRPGAAGDQPALEQQARAADSARHAPAARGKVKSIVEKQPAAAVSTTAPAQRTRLDLDVATAAQIDSLPGMSPALSKRIVADRIVKGPFQRLDALRRVKGVSARLIQRIDSLVTFSGTIPSASPADTTIPKAVRRSGRRRRP
jgi:DNA uptake protein ComE-like DNA-binding protein